MMSPYWYFKNQRRKHTQIWAAAVWATGQAATYAFCCLAMGSGLTCLPLPTPRPEVSVKGVTGCKIGNPNSDRLTRQRFIILQNWKPDPARVALLPPLGRP